MKISATMIREMAEEILSDIDYDIYKEDLEEDLGLTDDIESKLKILVEFLGSEVVKD
jgi:hypothetical protein